MEIRQTNNNAGDVNNSVDGGVTVKPPPKLCEVCGDPKNGQAYWECHEYLGCVCQKCRIRGMIWAAKESLKTE